MTILLEQAKLISDILSTFADQKLPIKLSYKIMKILSQLEPELQFYQTQFTKLIQTCAETDEQGQIQYTEDKQNIKLKPDKVEDFHKEYQELLGIEIQIDQFFFTLDELDGLEISPKDLYILEPYITTE